MKLKLAVILPLLAIGILAPATEFRIEPENFQDRPETGDPKDGWRLWRDGALLGKAGMLSVGGAKLASGEPNEILGEFTVKKGTYYIWARVVNFGEKWRTMDLSINGTKVGTVGDRNLKKDEKKGSLGWQKIRKPVELDGATKFVLTAGPKGMPRIDSIIISDDKDFNPSKKTFEELAEIEEIEAD
ncbi:MAG: hypothetical protein MJ025_00405 [Victivallaceae bacterium]|nr:hypothetical protein [Victivallaceae bacterium]